MRTRLVLLSLLLVGPAPATFAEEQTAALAPEIRASDLRVHLDVLAADAMRGRESLSPEAEAASAYLARQLEACGVEPLGIDGTWYQPYVIQQPVLEEGNRLEVVTGDQTRAFEVEKDWNPFSVSARGSVEGGVVFAGYGIQAEGRGWDDYAGVDVQGKVVLVLRKNPGWREQRHAAFTRKLAVAVERGAAALLLVNDPETVKAAGGDRIGHWAAPTGGPTGSGRIPFAFVSQEVAAALLAPLGRSLDALETALRADGPCSSEVPGVSVKLTTALATTEAANTRNVVGYLPGRDPDVAEETVVLGAHYDHVGLGTYGSLGGRDAAGEVHNGADDNGSGTAALLELAQWFAVPENRPRRSLLFVAFSGEERGLLGSQHFVEHPTVPLEDIVLMVNMDMVGRSKDGHVQVGGVGTAEGLQDLVARRNEPHGLRTEWDPQGTAPSDSTSFFRKRIPVLFFFTGLHKDYHRPSDDVEHINFGDLVRVAHLVRDVVREVGDREERLAFTMPPEPPQPPVLGIVPSPEPNPFGLLVASVAPDGPAMQGGMEDGDVIVELAGQAVRDLQGLVQVLRRLEAGKAVKIVVLRGDERVPLSVVLVERAPRR